MWPFTKRQQPIQQQRHATDKVFVERDGNHYEYSIDEPAALKHRVEDLLDGYYSQSNYLTLFTCLPELFAPIHEIASRVSDAVWELKSVHNDKVDYRNEDFNRLFSNPNPFMNNKLHIYQAVCYWILLGRQFFFFNRSKLLGDGIDSVITWMNLDCSARAEMIPNVDPYTLTSMDQMIRYWYVYNDKGQRRKFDTDRVLPFVNYDISRGKDTYNPNKPVSLVKGADKAIKNLIPVYEARGVIFIKRGAMGFMVSKKSDASGNVSLTKPEKEEARKEFNNTYGLTGGKDTVGLTSVPLEFIRTAMSIAELLPFDETLADAVAIYKVLRVPRHLVPSKDNSTFANANADMVAFYDDVIIPLAEMFAEAFTNYFAIPNRYIKPSYAHIKVLQENIKEKNEALRAEGEIWEKRFRNGVCTLNDWIMATDGFPGTGTYYEKKFFEMTPEEQEVVIGLLKLQIKQNETEANPGKVKADKAA